MTTSSMIGVIPSIETIIKPVSGQTRLTRNCSTTPLRISDGPRLHLDVRLEEIPIQLSDQHYCLLVKLFNAFKMRVRVERFKRWRPTGKPVLGNAALWWRFATNATMDGIQAKNRRRSLQFALKKSRRNVAYVKGYTQHLTEVGWVRLGYVVLSTFMQYFIQGVVIKSPPPKAVMKHTGSFSRK